MKKRFLILIMSVLTACACLFSMSACGGSKNEKEDETSGGGNSEQTSTWEDEDITDEEHGEIELPEIER